MIVPMKKVYLITRADELVPSLQSLRDLGVLHIEHVQAPRSGEIHRLKDCIKLVQDVVSFLTHEHKDPHQACPRDWEETADVILGLAALMDQDRAGIAKRQMQVEEWEPWGDFRLEDIDFLRGRGLRVELVAVPEAELSRCPAGVVLEPVFVKHKVARCLAVAPAEVEFPYRGLALPPDGLARIKEEQERLRKRVKMAHQQQLDDSKYLDFYQGLLADLKERLAFQRVLEGGGRDASLGYVKGFCPVDVCPRLEAEAGRRHWGVLFEDPAPEDAVPTLLRNPRWVQIIQSVFRFADIVPGYREIDISLVFLVFFALFAGMLIGDLGYGLILLALIVWAQKKNKGKAGDPKPFILGYVLCVGAVAWGLLTGTVFGQAWLEHSPVKPLVPWLLNNGNMQLLCFLIGAVHLSIAHGWRAVVKAPDLSFLSEIGWLVFVWGMFFLVRMLVLDQTLPTLAVGLLAGGMFLILFFTKPSWNPLVSLKAVGVNIVFDFINVFTDVISYIRLFAVGLATVAVADAANLMPLPGLLFLHALNIVLALLAIMVHGFRLNILEFSRHMGMEWVGLRYDPFKVNRKEMGTH